MTRMFTSRRDRLLCRRKVDPAISVQTRTNERGIGHYLERHRDNLPPEVRIALERRRATATENVENGHAAAA
jgi:hypothetical protein